MAKNITKKIKLQAMGGMATPAPPLGPALGQAGVNISDFVQKFNAATAEVKGEKVGVKNHCIRRSYIRFLRDYSSSIRPPLQSGRDHKRFYKAS